VESDTAGAASPGWYADPYRRFEFRYFNGERWTADVSIRGQRYVDHPQQFAPEQPQRPPGRGKAIAAFVVALSSLALGWAPFMFVITLAGSVVALVLGVRALRRLTPGQPGRRFAIAGIAIVPFALASSVVGIFVTQEVVDRFVDLIDVGEYDLTENQPCTATAGLFTLDGTITNLDDRTHDYRITVEFTSADERLRRSTDTETVQPGATTTWSVSGFSAADEVSCRVVSVGGLLAPATESTD
jgi:hypothetical protein